MEHCAIDLGGRKSQICVRASDGTVVLERKQETLALGEFLSTRAPSRVILETCAEAFRVADLAREAGHEVRVVPATLVRTLGVGARRTKTDRKDAAALSEVSTRIDLPSVHIPSKEARERKAICGMREALVHARTMLINNVRGWLRSQGIRIRSGMARHFSSRVREYGELPDYVVSQLKAIECLSEQIIEADQRIARIAKTDAVCRRLMTVPGVGAQTAVRFAATVDNVSRFANAHRLESYLGLVPGEYSSSDVRHRLSITKAGSASTRWILVQAAWAVRTRTRSAEAQHLKLWHLEVEKRRGRHVAIVALARKLAGILYAVWRDGTTYHPAS